MKNLSLPFVFVLMLAGVLFAQEQRVGYVHMGKLFDAYYRSVEANVTLEEKKLDLQKGMKLLRNDLESLAREVQKAQEEANNELLGEIAREQAAGKYQMRMENFQQKRAEFEEKREAAMESLRKMQLQSEETLSKELLRLLKAFSRAKGYDQIWDVSGNSMNRLPVLLVYPEEQDLTQMFVEAVNHGHEKGLAKTIQKLEHLRKLNGILATGGELPVEEPKKEEVKKEEPKKEEVKKEEPKKEEVKKEEPKKEEVKKEAEGGSQVEKPAHQEEKKSKKSSKSKGAKSK